MIRGNEFVRKANPREVHLSVRRLYETTANKNRVNQIRTERLTRFMGMRLAHEHQIFCNVR
jgi:hypothetical protein